jgi:S1-C subfamily serine protease
VIGTDETTDLAVIKLDSTETLPFAALGHKMRSIMLDYNYLGRSLNSVDYVTLLSHDVTHYIDRRVRFNLVRLADWCWTIK